VLPAVGQKLNLVMGNIKKCCPVNAADDAYGAIEHTDLVMASRKWKNTNEAPKEPTRPVQKLLPGWS
jgi:hypothetical protein